MARRADGPNPSPQVGAATKGDDDESTKRETTRRRRRYDPVERHRELEKELFRLKFERAEFIERADVREWTDRRNREEMKELLGRLEEVRACVDGIDGCGGGGGSGGEVGEGGGGETEPKRGEEKSKCADGEKGGLEEGMVWLEGLREKIEEVWGSVVEEGEGAEGGESDNGVGGEDVCGGAAAVEERWVGLDDREGLMQRKDRLESVVAMLRRDVTNIRSELQSEREQTEDVSEARVRSEADHYRAEADQKSKKSRGERSLSKQNKLQVECTDLSVEISNLREKKREAEKEVRAIRERIGLIHAEQTKLEMRAARATEQARTYRHDAVMSRRQSERVRDEMLARKDPVEYRRRRPERRERKRRERAEDAAFHTATADGGGMLQPLLPGMGRRHSSEALTGDVVMPSPSRHMSARAVLPGLGRRHSSDQPRRQASFPVPGSW